MQEIKSKDLRSRTDGSTRRCQVITSYRPMQFYLTSFLAADESNKIIQVSNKNRNLDCFPAAADADDDDGHQHQRAVDSRRDGEGDGSFLR